MQLPRRRPCGGDRRGSRARILYARSWLYQPIGVAENTAAPAPFRLTLAEARARWPEWAAAHNERREHGRAAATERFGAVVADLLLRIHLPEFPRPTEVVAFALDLKCGHEEFLLGKRADASKPVPERARCPVFWSCHLNNGRSAVRYLEPGEPEPQYEGLGFT